MLASLWIAALDHPSARYLVHLRGPGWNVAGVTSPWRPGIVAGHNERIAWSFVASPTDTQDVIVERLHPADHRQRATAAGWGPLTTVQEAVPVKGRATAFGSEQQFTPHGPVMAVDRERHLAYVVAWPGSEPGTAAELGGLEIGRATTWSEFRRALETWNVPAAEFVYADVDGHVGVHTAGLVPVRSSGHASVPVAGSAATGRRAAWVPYHRLPFSIDPPVGRVLASPGSPARRRRLESLLKAPPIGLAAVQRMQRDVIANHAEQLVPLLSTLTTSNAAVDGARQRLLAWDRQMATTSIDAPLFAAWERALTTMLAATRVPPSLVAEYVAAASSPLVDAIVGARRTWFEGDARAARDRLLLEALAAAVDAIEQQRPARDAPTWADLRAAVFAHPLGVSAQARRRFDVGPFALAGYADTVAASGRTAQGRAVGPAVRLAIDLADWDRSRAAIAPGQSEAADSRHFADLFEAWSSGSDVPLVFTEGAVAAALWAGWWLWQRAAERGEESSGARSGCGRADHLHGLGGCNHEVNTAMISTARQRYRRASISRTIETMAATSILCKGPGYRPRH